MKLTIASLAACVLIAGTFSAARADDAALKATLQGRYAAMKTAMAARDDKAVAALLAPNFASVDVSGQSENAAQMLQEVDALAKDPNRTSTTTLLAIKVDASVATVKQRYDMKTVKTAADGTKRNIELVTLSTDKWINTNGTWLLQETDTNQLDYFINGQLAAHKVRPQT